jgi:hypothetical protein
VPGQLGDNAVLDRSGPRLRVTHLELAFDGWLGDELVTTHPAFAATRHLADLFVQAGLSGFSLRDMEVSRSEEFQELYPDRDLPEFVELVITGTAGVDDLGLDDTDLLIMSERAIEIMNTTNPLDADITPFAG